MAKGCQFSILTNIEEDLAMMMTKNGLHLASLALLLSCAGPSLAESEVPNLVGKWSGKAEGALILKGEAPSKRVHATDAFFALTYSLDFTEQQGRLVRGTRTSARYTEQVVCVIDYDNESIRCTDEDGVLDGELENNNEITYHYHHVSAEESVVAVGVMTRDQ
jgi:hypothetical protein